MTKSKHSFSTASDEDTSVVHKARLLFSLAYRCWGRANKLGMILWTNEMFLLLENSLPGIHYSSTSICAETFSSLALFLQYFNVPNHACSKRRPNCHKYNVEREKCVRLFSWSQSQEMPTETYWLVQNFETTWLLVLNKNFWHDKRCMLIIPVLLLYVSVLQKTKYWANDHIT